MPARSALWILLAAATLAVVPSPAFGQACSRLPRANAGQDVVDCIATVGTTDFTLTGSDSVPVAGNGPIVEHCWTTDYGTFTATGTDTACLADADVVLRVPNTPGRSLITVDLVVRDASGCTDDDEVTLDLSTPPVITRAQPSTPRLCLGEVLDLLGSAVNTFNVTGLVEYRWDIDLARDTDANGDAGDDSDIVRTGVSGQLAVGTFTPGRAGRFTGRLHVSVAGHDCGASSDFAYEVAVGPAVRLVVGPATLCPNQVGDFRAELAFGTAATDMIWDFDISVDSNGDGDPANDVEASGQQVAHAFPESGTYLVRASARGSNECLGFEDRSILVKPGPVPAFTTSGPGCGPLAVTFTDLSAGLSPLTVSWNFGDGSPVEPGTRITHVYSSPGTYRISHVVTDAEGCTQSTEVPVDVRPSSAAIEGVTILDGQPGTGSVGNANGFADAGERVRIVVDVRNTGGTTSSDLVATLVSQDPDGMVTVSDGSASVPVLAPGASGSTLSPHLEAEISTRAACGSSLPVEVRVASAGAGACVDGLAFALRIGVPGLQRLGSELAVFETPGRAEPLDAAFGSGAHHVLLLDATGSSTRARLSRWSSTGQRLGPDLLLDDVAGTVRQGQVAWAPGIEELGAAWIAVEPGSATPGNVGARFRRVNSGGFPLGVSRRLDLSGNVGTIDLTWAENHWIVAFTDRAPGAGSAQLMAQVLTADGLLLGSPLALGGTVSDDGDVRVASVGDRTIVAHRTGSELRIYEVTGLRPARLVSQQTWSDASGIPAITRHAGGFLVAFESLGGIDVAWMPASGAASRSLASASGSRPVLASGPDLGIVAWESGDEILARVLGATGKAAGDAFVVSQGVDPALRPAISAGTDGLFLAAFASRGFGGAILARAALLGPSLPEDCVTGVIGDIAPQPGGDGRLDVGDAVLALRAAVGLVTVTPEMIAVADVAPGERTGNVHRIIGNGVIDVADVVVLLQASTGAITLVP